MIDHEGTQLGIVDTHGALMKARELGLDLVEVSPTSRPPVCRIMDYGKFKYAQKKKERKARANRHETELKEVRIRTPKISKHDLQIKINHARAFLMRGDRVQFTLRFRGREMAHVNLGQEIMIAIKAGLVGVGKVERDFKMEGKRATMVVAATVAPKPRQMPKPAAAGKAAPGAAAVAAVPALSAEEIERQARSSWRRTWPKWPRPPKPMRAMTTRTTRWKGPPKGRPPSRPRNPPPSRKPTRRKQAKARAPHRENGLPTPLPLGRGWFAAANEGYPARCHGRPGWNRFLFRAN